MISLRGRAETPTSSVTWSIASATIGTYLLIVAGISNALTGAAHACPSWPLCLGGPAPSLAVAIVLAHRLTAAIVGLLLVWSLVQVYRGDGSRRVFAALAGAVLLYPFEVGLGAKVALSGASPPIPTIHLAVAMVIFSALMAALVWHLEADVAPEASPGDDPTPTPGSRGPEGEPPEPHHPAGPLARVSAYVRLTKPYLWWLLSLVALASMGLAAGGVPPLETTVATLVGGVLAIGACGTFNNVYERDRDRRMERTADRPVATHTIPPGRAVGFGLLLTVASLGVFLWFVNPLTAALGLLAILYYSVGYTMVLKPTTEHNTVIGGAVGAFPALIGWAAITDTIGLPAIVLGAVIFLWTPAHFYNLALLYKHEYERAGFPMLPVVRGERATRRHIVGFLGATMLAAVLLATDGALGALYGGTAVLLGAVFLLAVVSLVTHRTDRSAKRAFIASNAYLGTLLLAIVLDTMAI